MDSSDEEYSKISDKSCESTSGNADIIRKSKPRNAKETGICISLVVLTMISTVCIMTGTLVPEMVCLQANLTNYKGLIDSRAKSKPHVIEDKIVIINIGLWVYCYDDQLYELMAMFNPPSDSYPGRNGNLQYTKTRGQDKRDRKNKMENDGKGNLTTEIGNKGLKNRCHTIPKLWYMPYHVTKKVEVTKILFLVGTTSCLVSFLTSVLVLITRLPLLKPLLLLPCFVAAVSITVGIGLLVTSAKDGERHYDEHLGPVWSSFIVQELGLHIGRVELGGLNLSSMKTGFCGVLVGCGCCLMVISVVLSEISRHNGS